MARALTLELVSDVRKAAKGIDSLDRKVSGFGSGVATVGKAVAGAFAVGAVVEFGQAAVTAASDAQQAAGAVESIFGEASGAVQSLAAESAETVGLATSDYNQLASVTGALLKEAVGNTTDLVTVTDDVITTGADLAAQFGGTSAEAVDALGSALKGSFDPLEKYGISLSAASVEAKAVELGLADASGEVDANAKKLATLELVTEKSTDAQGAFARELDTVAGKQQVLTAEFENAQAEIGAALLPIVLELFNALRPLIDPLVGIVQALVPLIELVGLLITPAAELIGVMGELLAGVLEPFVGLLVRSLTPAIDALTGVFSDLTGYLDRNLEPILARVEGWFDNIGDAVEDVIGWIGRIRFPSLPSWLGGGRSLTAPGVRVPTGVRGAAGAYGPSSVTIQVEAGLSSPSRVAQAVVDALEYAGTVGITRTQYAGA